MKAHAIILCMKSDWFKAALAGNGEQAESRQIRVDNMDPATMKILLKHVYAGGKYNPIPTFPCGFCLWTLLLPNEPRVFCPSVLRPSHLLPQQPPLGPISPSSFFTPHNIIYISPLVLHVHWKGRG